VWQAVHSGCQFDVCQNNAAFAAVPDGIFAVQETTPHTHKSRKNLLIFRL
jgi:hypothetical protein